MRKHRDKIKDIYCYKKNNFSLIRIKDKVNRNSMNSIKKLVKRTLNKKLIPLIKKFGKAKHQLSLF